MMRPTFVSCWLVILLFAVCSAGGGGVAAAWQVRRPATGANRPHAFSRSVLQGQRFHNKNNNNQHHRDLLWTIPRGGAVGASSSSPSSLSSSSCVDSDWHLALKVVGVTAAAETAGLMALLWGAQRLVQSPWGQKRTPNFLRRTVRGLPLLQWISLAVTIFFPSAVKSLVDGGVSAASNQVLKPNVTPGDSGAWYASLAKPWFNPPGWVFPIMWLIVSKPTQMWGVSRLLKQQQQAGESESSSSSTLSTTNNNKNLWPVLAVYCAHLALGDAWNQVFFGCQRIRLGAQVIAAFWSLLATSSVLFGGMDKRAGLLLLPTLGWVTVATALNLEILRLNK